MAISTHLQVRSHKNVNLKASNKAMVYPETAASMGTISTFAK